MVIQWSDEDRTHIVSHSSVASLASRLGPVTNTLRLVRWPERAPRARTQTSHFAALALQFIVRYSVELTSR